MYFSIDLAYLISGNRAAKTFPERRCFRLLLGHKMCPVSKLQTSSTKADSGSPTDNCGQVHAVEFGVLRYVNRV